MKWQRMGDTRHQLPIPRRHSDGAAGYDLAAAVNIELKSGEMLLVPTGWAVQLPELHVGLIRDRSGMARNGITTRAGVIDPDYRGEIRVLLCNESRDAYRIEAGTRIAQLVVVTCVMVDSWEAELDATERGTSGFGSTGR